jgi:hypothetical protein
MLGAAGKRLANAFHQDGVVEGLFQKIDGTVAHRGYRHRNVGGAGEENYGKIETAFPQYSLQLDPRHRGHHHVEQQHGGGA